MLAQKFLVLGCSILSLLFFSQLALADNATELVGSRTLNYAMDHVNCRMTFVTNYVNYLSIAIPQYFPNHNLYTGQLILDQQQLQNYTNTVDVSDYRYFLKNNFDPDFKQFKDAVNIQLTNANPSPTVLNAIRTNYAKLLSDYDKCSFIALNNYAAEKVNAYNTVINYYQLEMFSLSSKGIDIYPLVALLQKENSQIIQPLSTISNTFTPTPNGTASLKQALNNYCLFDGCINGFNGHLSANFEVTKLQIILDFMAHNPKYNNAKDILAHAQDSLNIAETALAELGTSPYSSNEQKNQIWGNIEATSKDLRQVVSIYGG